MKPTREQIENAAPGELNGWVAEMMGWRWLCHPDPALARRYLIEPESVTDFMESDPRWINAGPEVLIARDPCERVPDFSTDPAAAWGLLEWVATQTDAIAVIISGNGHARAQIELGGSPWDSHLYVAGYCKIRENPISPKARMRIALCRAALLWWIEQPENEG